MKEDNTQEYIQQEKGTLICRDRANKGKNSYKTWTDKSEEEKRIYFAEIEKEVRETTENIRQGDVYYVDFLTRVGSVISGYRPAIVVGNTPSNNKSSTIQVIPMTTRSARHATHVYLEPMDFISEGELYGSALAEHRCSVSISQLIKKVGILKQDARHRVLAADVLSIEPRSNCREDFLKHLIENGVFTEDNLKNVLGDVKSKYQPTDLRIKTPKIDKNQKNNRDKFKTKIDWNVLTDCENEVGTLSREELKQKIALQEMYVEGNIPGKRYRGRKRKKR